jgi:hypothetical protein
MDYSLFFCVEHNPEYVHRNKHEYVCEDGEIIYPVREVDNTDHKSISKQTKFDNERIKTQVTNEFMSKLAGLDKA